MAVHDMSVEVAPRTITGPIGPNAAGKTTLFNLISGLCKADAGAIHFNGERIDGLPPHRIFHKGICRTFQITHELKLMTVLENPMLVPPGQAGESLLNTWLRPWRVRPQERDLKEKALDVLRFVRLIDLKDEYAGNLSAGQKRLLELARTMMAEPQLLLLDEPGAGVNPTLLKRLVDYIRRLAFERGMTIFLIEHDVDLVMNTCDRVIVMNSGEILAEGPPEVIRRDPQVGGDRAATDRLGDDCFCLFRVGVVNLGALGRAHDADALQLGAALDAGPENGHQLAVGAGQRVGGCARGRSGANGGQGTAPQHQDCRVDDQQTALRVVWEHGNHPFTQRCYIHTSRAPGFRW